ncbi:unnamed protein product [Phytophthora lilii]|uniref:Unnamed protein product n=1 Tax=Phytophthora lilii TaxID=2077276 RepID=A0A9W7DCX9_9STRA|nr:unnamed protein product [Phytophthora lilii]
MKDDEAPTASSPVAVIQAGDRSEPGNYRPLTLLNHDAKLGPKFLAWRLGEVLPAIINEDEKGFVPGRSIRHLLLQFHDLQKLCQMMYPDACAVLIDFAKAFDSVLWPALDMILTHFGFGPTIRQGDPLSPGLFVVFIEPMLNYLRKHFTPKGLLVRPSQTPHLVMAFADDCTGLLRDIADAKTFISLVQDFSDAAGMRLNMKKTCVMPFTHHVSRAKLAMLRTTSALHVLSITDTTKLLGILQGASITPRERIAVVIRNLRNRCSIWKYRARTLKGKVVLLQTIILPLLWYTASVICVPPDVRHTVDTIIRNFVHSKDTDLDDAAPGKFNSNWSYTKVDKGGLGLTPAKEFIQAMHLKCLQDAIAATVQTGSAPRWFLPALTLFTTALSPLGEGFDVLYANLSGLMWNPIPKLSFIPPIFSRPASRAGLVSDTLKRFNLITPLVEPTNGPCRPAIIEAAYHNWRFENQPVVDMANRDVLPICEDLKFRVQHNALGFLYKFHWRTNVASPDQCIHDCSAKENAVHLFWEC